HGLHNALAGIHQVLQLLLPKLPDDEINQELATYCHESLQRANQLANEMRELIKGAGRGSVAVKGLCEGAVAALADEGTGAAVTVSCPADVDYGGDAAALIQLLRGLLKDAPVALATSAPLRLSAEPGPGRLVFRVESEQRAAPPGGPSNVEGEDGSASDEGPVPLDPACHALALQLGGRLLLERTPVRSITLDVPNPAQPLV
ncbi:MAG TPA: hypothetical protein VEI97_06120, partial [bacterium]|nr:hypothetical protein [bacterium]